MPDLFREFGCRPGKLAAHGGGYVDHLDAPAFQADFFQQLPRKFYALSGFDITIQVMTIALQSTRHHHTVCTILKSAQHVQHVKLACAGQFDNLNGGGVFQSHGPGKICRSVGAVVTAERDDFGYKGVFTHNILLLSIEQNRLVRNILSWSRLLLCGIPVE
jgi:hypothetical protein